MKLDYIMIVFEYRVYIKCKDKGMYTMSNIYIYISESLNKIRKVNK